MSNGEDTRRSQVVRSRRMHRRAGKPAQKRGVGRRNVPAMVARNTAMERRLNSGRSAARRPKYLSLATEGAELRLPALPTIHLGWRVVSAGMVLALLFALYASLTSPAFTVGRVEIGGAQRLSAQDVNRVLAVAGSSVFSIQPDKLATILADAFPELEDFSVRVGLPARVLITVDERRPVVAWQQSGITVWVDSAGVAFIPEGEEQPLVEVQALEAPPVLVAQEGAARHQLISPEMVAAALAISQQAPQGVELLYSAKYGFGWTDPAGWDAYFGAESESLDQRMAVYNAIVAELQDRGLVPTLISVAQLHAPYYRLDY
jgi:cell division septal protein FtsQ